MSGAYFQYGDLRQVALKMAIESADDYSINDIVARAHAYFRFLTADSAMGKSKIPSQKSEGTKSSGSS